MSDALRIWVDHLWQYSTDRPRVDELTVYVTLDTSKVASDQGRVVLGQAPEGTTLVFYGPAGYDRLDLAAEHAPPRELVVHVDPTLKQLAVTGTDEALPSVELLLQRGSPALVLTSLHARQLIVRGGRVESREDAPQHLIGENAILDVSWSVETLELRGAVGVRSGPLHARRAFVMDEAVISEGGELHFYEFLPRTTERRPRLVVKAANVHVRWAAPGATFVGEGGGLYFGEREGRPLRSLDISGAAPVAVQGVLEETSFQASASPVPINVEGRLLDASGPVGLQAARGAVVSGAARGALVLRAVHGVVGAELENVNIYGLGIRDLTNLKEAERVYPWVPRPPKARELEDAMFLDQDTGLSKRQRMHFWASMADILKEKGAPGRVQSEVRYAAQRARRIALPLGRERLLLTAYGLLGYGERILRPLIWYAALSLGLAVWFSAPSQADAFTWSRTAEIWLSIAESPLAFFRLASVPVRESTPQETALLAFRVAGLLLLLLPIFALRRLVRLE